jgi:hypothetical protein
MKCEGFARKFDGLIRGSIVAFAWGGLEKPLKSQPQQLTFKLRLEPSTS